MYIVALCHLARIHFPGMTRAAVVHPGDRFGRLLVLEETDERRRRGRVFRCLCDCGNETLVQAGNLKAKTRSCGCARNSKPPDPTKHGHAKNGAWSPTYISWKSMLARCENPNRPKYPHYGGRGIKVCPLFHDFATFLAFMGERPEGTSLDRADNNQHYDPINCRWATPTEQRANRRR